MNKKYLIVVFLFTVLHPIGAQTLTLKKGTVIDSVAVRDSVNSTYAVYLPTDFVTTKTWPVVFVLDLKGNSKRAMSMFVGSAEEEGYILAAPNNISDTLSLSNNMLSVGKVVASVKDLLPLDNSRIYTGGFSDGGRFASLVPLFIKGISGVISCNASLANTELLNGKRPFHLISIARRQDFVYTDLLREQKLLNKLKFENDLVLFENDTEWPETKHLLKALKILKMNKMAKGAIAKDSSYIKANFDADIEEVQKLIKENKLLLADHQMKQMLSSYRLNISTDSLKQAKKELRKRKTYRSLKRSENNAFFQESLLREDYQYYLEEDVLTYNFNNLGWWNYQMEELKKFLQSEDAFKQRMGKRVKGFLNALVDDNIDVVRAEKVVDEEALVFLSMLKTIIAPKEYQNYLQVIALSSKNEDFGTALFYLEELLKNGFKDKDQLYEIEHAALFRITPEFDAMVTKYFRE